MGCSPWGLEESDTTGRLHFHFSLSCIGEGNGNPLQCSCLENPRNSGVWWAAVYGVAQSQTRLKQRSSSSSSSCYIWASLVAQWVNQPAMQETACNAGLPGFDPWVRKIPWRRKSQLSPVFLPGKSHGQRSLRGYSP